jgi:hypothetical protein
MAGFSNSAIASATYTINGSVAAPIFSVAAGTYNTAQTVSISTATSGATIYYTTDGTTPTSSSASYSSALSISSTIVLRAIALKSGFSDSTVTTANYVINDVPTFFSAYAGDAQVLLDWVALSGASSYNIYWNTTGSPTKASSKLTTSSTTLTQAGLTNGTIYYYAIAAVVGGVEGALSSVVTATPSLPSYTSQAITMVMS